MSDKNQPRMEPERGDAELTDDDLDSVAGGKRTWSDYDIPDPVIQPIEPMPLPAESV